MNGKASVSKELNAKHRKVPCFTFVFILLLVVFRLVAENILEKQGMRLWYGFSVFHEFAQ